MSRRTGLVTLAAACLTAAAPADFLDVVIVDVTAETGPPFGTVWRLHARFDDPTDQILAVGSTSDVPFDFRATTNHLNDGGGFSGIKPEDFPLSPVGPAYDSYFTLGHTTFIDSDTFTTPDWLVPSSNSPILEGQSELYTPYRGGWYDTDPDDTPMTGTFIAIAQFWLPEGAGLAMSAAVTWRPAGAADVISAFAVAQPDCNANGRIDNEEIADGSVTDLDGNGVPDLCECIGDIAEDGTVDAQDLVALLAVWGTCDECAEDLDGSGAVDFADLILLLTAWGPCPTA